jgi:hypothetical protein
MRFVSMQSALAISVIFAVSAAAAQDGTVTTAPLTGVDERAHAQASGLWALEVGWCWPCRSPARAGGDRVPRPWRHCPTGLPGVVNGWRRERSVCRRCARSPRARRRPWCCRPRLWLRADQPLERLRSFQRWTMEATTALGETVHSNVLLDGGRHFVLRHRDRSQHDSDRRPLCSPRRGGNFGSNWLFCPSYFNGGPGGAVPIPAGDAERVLGADSFLDHVFQILTATTPARADDHRRSCPTRLATTIGRSRLNFVDAPEMVFGYPQDRPSRARSFNRSPASTGTTGLCWGGQVSKIISSDLTDGANGGGWFIGWRHPSVGSRTPTATSSPTGVTS